MSNRPDFPAIRRLGPDDLRNCAALAVDRGWWPERDKWALLLAASEVYGVDAPDGRGLAATVSLTRWGDNRAGLGMMLVAMRYGSRGLGRLLMEYALGVAGEGTDVWLYATDSGRPLYEKLGFKPVRKSVAFRGRFRASPQANKVKKHDPQAGAAEISGTVRVATEADLPVIITLDRATYGADRERMLSRLPDFTDRIVVFESSEGIVGYGAGWRTEAYTMIGPLMAPDGAAARRMVTDLASHSPVAIRLDLDPERPELPGWASACGLLATERTVVMVHGDVTPHGVPERLYTPISVAMA
jgi:hypothetical protein